MNKYLRLVGMLIIVAATTIPLATPKSIIIDDDALPTLQQHALAAHSLRTTHRARGAACFNKIPRLLLHEATRAFLIHLTQEFTGKSVDLTRIILVNRNLNVHCIVGNMVQDINPQDPIDPPYCNLLLACYEGVSFHKRGTTYIPIDVQLSLRNEHITLRPLPVAPIPTDVDLALQTITRWLGDIPHFRIKPMSEVAAELIMETIRFYKKIDPITDTFWREIQKIVRTFPAVERHDQQNFADEAIIRCAPELLDDNFYHTYLNIMAMILSPQTQAVYNEDDDTLQLLLQGKCATFIKKSPRSPTYDYCVAYGLLRYNTRDRSNGFEAVLHKKHSPYNHCGYQQHIALRLLE